MSFGEVLRNLREAAGVRLKGLANEIGWSVVYLSDIERGRRTPPSAENICKISKFLKTDPETLLSIASKERKRIELELSSKSQTVQDFAVVLARSWDGMTEEEALELTQILRRKQSQNGGHSNG